MQRHPDDYPEFVASSTTCCEHCETIFRAKYKGKHCPQAVPDEPKLIPGCSEVEKEVKDCDIPASWGKFGGFRYTKS
jgi:hypothetical protein